MAKIVDALAPEVVNRTSAATIKIEYKKLAEAYNKMADNKILHCPRCDSWRVADSGFYFDKRLATNRFPICKQCIMEMVEQRDKKTGESHETKESVRAVLQLMNKVYDNEFYESCVKDAGEGIKEKNRPAPFATYITAINSLPQYREKTYANSIFGNDEDIDETNMVTKKIRKETRRMFGLGFSESDYAYLQDQYDDWKLRTTVDSKSQETYVIQICLQLLDIFKARKAGRDVTSMLKALDTLMNAANLQPKQNVGNSATDTLTFGQLIEKWELEKPVPEPSEEFKDVDGIGHYIRVWFTGCLSHAMGLNNIYEKEYQEEIDKYAVKKVEYTEDNYEDDVYNKLFGSSLE